MFSFKVIVLKIEGDIMEYVDFKNEILELIERHAEGEYWDFKQQRHSCNADLLHDIFVRQFGHKLKVDVVFERTILYLNNESDTIIFVSLFIWLFRNHNFILLLHSITYKKAIFYTKNMVMMDNIIIQIAYL